MSEIERQVALPIVMATREGNPVFERDDFSYSRHRQQLPIHRTKGHLHGAQFRHNKDLRHRACPDKEVAINQA